MIFTFLIAVAIVGFFAGLCTPREAAPVTASVGVFTPEGQSSKIKQQLPSSYG